MITGQRPRPASMGSTRPGGGRPPGRRGRGGVGPGPGYRPGGGGGGTKHGSSSGTRAMAWAAGVIFGVPALIFVACLVWVVLA